jgi:hypothetical protein
MCFSLLASVAAGTILSVAGAATVTMARRRAELPLALIPLLFGVQQLIEGAVWWSLDQGDPTWNLRATLGYMIFSHVLWPVFVPFVYLCLEVVPWHRFVLAGFLALGAGVGLDGLFSVVQGPSTSHVTGSSIQYETPSLLVIVLYLVATCVSAFFSSYRVLRALGAAALGLALVTSWLYTAVFVSVWCFFSAILTLGVFLHFRSLRRPGRRPTIGRSSASPADRDDGRVPTPRPRSAG